MGNKRLGLMLMIPLLGVAGPAAADDWRRYDDRHDRYRDDGRYGYRDDRGGAFDEGYTRGYQDGAKEGSKDGRRGRRFELWREDRYRDGDHGYKSRYGSRASYVSGYRRGYEQGYRRGYHTRSAWRDDGRVIHEYPRW